MALPQTMKSSSGEYEPLEAGTYEATLKRIDLDIQSEYETGKLFNNGDGLRFQGCTLIWDVEGEEFRDKFVKVSLNRRAKLFNRFSALLGRELKEDDDKLDWGINSEAATNVEYDNYFKASNADFFVHKEEARFGTYDFKDAKMDDEGKPVVKVKKDDYLHLGFKNDGILGTLDSLAINGEELYGKSCLLVLTVKGQFNRANAGAASPLPRKQGRRVPTSSAPAAPL